MSSSASPITNAVLLTLFPKICRLDDYLARHLELEFVNELDSTDFKELLHNTLVANNTALATNVKPDTTLNKPFPSRNKPNPEGNQNEIVDQAIELTCPNNRSWFSGSFNILAIGYSNSRRSQSQQAENYFVNTLEAFVRSPLWETLLKRIGDDAMLYLLTSTSMFVALPNNCYCQITGPAISEQAITKRSIQKSLLPSLKRSASDVSQTSTLEPPSSSTPSKTLPNSDAVTPSGTPATSTEYVRASKRKKTEDENKKMSLPETTIKRSKIFYVRRYHTERIMLQHFLLSDYGTSRTTSLASASLVDTQMLRMFPRQYGLENVFVRTNVFSKNNQKGVNKAKVNHPWRLRQMRQLVAAMLEMNNKCKFEYLLWYYCPVKAVDEPSETQDTSIEALLKCHSSFEQVTSFVHSVVKKVIPLQMFGSTENRLVILRAMTRFIHLKKFEAMSLQYVLQGFKMSDCPWLQDSRLRDPDSRVSHIPPSASNKQHEILHEFIYWLFDGFLIPLLKASFYVTDSSFQRNRVFYYRHGLWHLIIKPAVSSIQEEMFIQMEPHEVAACNRTYANVRLLPKTHDLRPIINLRRKSSKLVNGSTSVGVRSMNQQLMNAFLVLGYEQSRQLSQKTGSAMGMSDLYQRFKQVKKKLVKHPQIDLNTLKSPKLFMVKVDIKKSFDSINQDKLLEIIDRTLKEDKYMIHRYSKVLPSNGHIMKRFLPRAVASNEMGSFLDFAIDRAKISKHAVLVVHTFESKSVIVNLIREHVNKNIVKFGKHFYRQTTGIPQGSILSPGLCRFFYDEMELNVLSELTNSHDSALLRLADDFLFISQSQEKAESFLKIMSDGQPSYGCYINEKKTIANFDTTLNGTPVQKCPENDFPYCGLLVNAKTLEIRVDYSRYHNEDIRDLLTVERDMHPARSITLKMK
ncbi:hypothetical protein BGX26_008583, partial [Mortierella sp. AD094]